MLFKFTIMLASSLKFVFRNLNNQMKSNLIVIDIALKRRICLGFKHLEGRVNRTTLLGIIKLDTCQYLD